MTSTYRGRFAPSPTGALHFGSLVAAFGSWLRARQRAGIWLVRVEDVDRLREVPGAARAQLETLRRFGFESDQPVVRQSQRAPLYLAALERLRQLELVFECRCSRSALAASGTGIHRGCLPGANGNPAALRARVPDVAIEFIDAVQGRVVQELARDVGEFVLRRVDGFFAYQLAVVVDDAEQRITEVVRGADLLDSTPRQIWLQRTLGFGTPEYAHLPLVLDAQGRKLSKADAALPVDPDDPDPALRAAWRFLGQDPALLPRACSLGALLRAAVATFDLGLVPRGPPLRHAGAAVAPV